jgi:hypothetical protein
MLRFHLASVCGQIGHLYPLNSYPWSTVGEMRAASLGFEPHIQRGRHASEPEAGWV